jgi:hypothetical protein
MYMGVRTIKSEIISYFKLKNSNTPYTPSCVKNSWKKHIGLYNFNCINTKTESICGRDDQFKSVTNHNNLRLMF